MTAGHELDDPSTLTKKPDIGDGFLPRKSDMTFWSRYDAVRNAGGPTDHWTKMKVRAWDRVSSAPAPRADRYDESLRESFGVAPGSYHLSRPRTVRQYQEALRTSYNQRAKEGFQYWAIDRPKPTPFGRYGIGSYKTVLGIGSLNSGSHHECHSSWHLNLEPHDLHVEELAETDPQYEKPIDLVPGHAKHRCENGQCKRIHICVGGQMFETQLGTLNRLPNTLLGNPIKRRRYWDPIKRCYFLNQHAPTFGAVLYYYQSGGRLYRPEDVPEDVFLKELDFYELGAGVLREFQIINGFLPEPEIELPKYSWQRAIWLTLEYPSSSSFSKSLAVLSLIIILLSIMNFCLETMPTFRNMSCVVDNSSAVMVNGERVPKEVLNVNSPFFMIECLCCFWFTSEAILRFVSCPSRRTFCTTWMNIFDIGAILPFYIIVTVVGITGSCSGGTSVVFLRVLRLFRAFRVFKLTKHSRGMQILGMTIRKSVEELYLFSLFLGIAVVFFSAALYYADMYDTNSANISSIPDGFWLTIITMCTVGYGDVVPGGIVGKLIDSVCVLSGVICIALVVPVVVTNFSNYYSHEQNGTSPKPNPKSVLSCWGRRKKE